MTRSFSKKHQYLATLMVDVVKLLSSKRGFKHIITLIVFEILKRKLPSIVRFVQYFLFGSNVKDQTNKIKEKIRNFTHRKRSNNEGEDEEEIDDLMKSENNSKNGDDQKSDSQQFHGINQEQEQQLAILKEVMASFFQENWKDHAQYIRDEVVYHFNIEKLQNDINQNLNIEKKQIQWENLKKEVFSFVPFSIITSTLLICTQVLREILKKKYTDSLQNDYPALHDPQEITCQIINEFFEQINLIGMKNVKAFVKQKLTRQLQDLSLQESFHIETIFEHLDEYFLHDLLKSNSSLKKPADHKKRSSMTLFRNNRRSKSHDSSSQRNQNSSMSYCDFNEFQNQDNGFNLHHLITSRLNNVGDQKHRMSDSQNSALFAHQQPVIAPHAKLDIIYLFLGDISDNKILQDMDFIEKHIEIADCKCREQRYQPSLQCIPEAEDDGYESDKSQYFHPSSNSNPASSNDINRPSPPVSQINHSIFNRNSIQNKQQQQYNTLESENQNTKKYRKLSDHAKNGTVHIDDLFTNKERYQKENERDDEDEYDEEDDEEEEDIQYSSNDQFLLELKGTKKKKKLNKSAHLKDQHHQATYKRDMQSQNDYFKKPPTPNFNLDTNFFPSIIINNDDNKKKQNNNINNNNRNGMNNHRHNDHKKKYEYQQNYFQQDDQIQEQEEQKKLQSINLTSHRFLSQEDGDEEDYNPTRSKSLKKQQQQYKQKNHSSNEYRSQDPACNDISFERSPKANKTGFETQEFLSSENESYPIIDEEEIIENRQRLTHFLQSLCFEALEILESTNFQTYLYYAILFQYKKFKNRFRCSIYENNLNKNMILMNIILQTNKILEEHFLAHDAQEKCDQIYQKYKNEVEKLIQDKTSKPSQTQLQNIKRIFEEIDQSIIIRESFEELTKFFILS